VIVDIWRDSIPTAIEIYLQSNLPHCIISARALFTKLLIREITRNRSTLGRFGYGHGIKHMPMTSENRNTQVQGCGGCSCSNTFFFESIRLSPEGTLGYEANVPTLLMQ